MNLQPTEQERLLIFSAAQLAKEHRARGIKLSHPEAVAYICNELLMAARQGKPLSELMGLGAEFLTTDDVMEGVAALMPVLHVEAMFLDGAKLITVHQPVRPGKLPLPDGPRAGEVIAAPGDIELNAGRRTTTLNVTNTGDRPVQVGSHYHFFEANRALDFDRKATFGMRLDVPSGLSVRFEPGQAKDVTLVEIGGRGEVSGFSNLTNGQIHDESVKEAAFKRAKDAGFKGA